MTTAHVNRIATAVPPHDVHDAFVVFARTLLADDRSRTLFDRMAERAGIARRFSFFQPGQPGAVKVDAEGFYRSGDLVRLRADGYLEVVGRIKDQINRGGEKIAAEEVENLLMAHPAITHAALVAMPDTALGEKSCAFVVSRDPALKSIALRKFLRGLGLADYKLPGV